MSEKGKNMENQITCLACKITITDHPVIDSAAKGGDHAMGSEYVVCECGERISFLGHYGPAQRTEKACHKTPKLGSQFLQELRYELESNNKGD